MVHGMKTRNDYQSAISAKLYAETPKAVFAAIAASLLLNHSGEDFANLDAAIVAEWAVLHSNGIVPQTAPRP